MEREKNKNNKAARMGILLAGLIFFSVACGHKAPPSAPDGKPPPRGAPGYSDQDYPKKDRKGY